MGEELGDMEISWKMVAAMRPMEREAAVVVEHQDIILLVHRSPVRRGERAD
jgi:hypothetical protein